MQYGIRKLFFLSAMFAGTLISAMNYPGKEASSAHLSDGEETLFSSSSDEKNTVDHRASVTWKESVQTDIISGNNVQASTALEQNAQIDKLPQHETPIQREITTLLRQERSTTLSEFGDDLNTSQSGGIAPIGDTITVDSKVPVSTLIPDAIKIIMGVTDSEIDEACTITENKNSKEYEKLLAMVTTSGKVFRSRKDSNMDVAITLFKLMHKKDVHLNGDLTSQLGKVQENVAGMQAEVEMVKDNIRTTARQRNITAAVGVVVAVIQFIISRFVGNQTCPTCPPCDLSVVFTNMTRNL